MTITLTREEAQQVLDALADAAGCVQENYQPGHMGYGWGKEIQTLRARLAQPESKPVAWADRYDIEREGHDFYVNRQQPAKNGVPLYTAPPQREWQRLTDEEVKSAALLGQAEKEKWINA
jgi:hypothetical protein